MWSCVPTRINTMRLERTLTLAILAVAFLLKVSPASCNDLAKPIFYLTHHVRFKEGVKIGGGQEFYYKGILKRYGKDQARRLDNIPLTEVQNVIEFNEAYEIYTFSDSFQQCQCMASGMTFSIQQSALTDRYNMLWIPKCAPSSIRHRGEPILVAVPKERARSSYVADPYPRQYFRPLSFGRMKALVDSVEPELRHDNGIVSSLDKFRVDRAVKLLKGEAELVSLIPPTDEYRRFKGKPFEYPFVIVSVAGKTTVLTGVSFDQVIHVVDRNYLVVQDEGLRGFSFRRILYVFTESGVEEVQRDGYVTD